MSTALSPQSGSVPAAFGSPGWAIQSKPNYGKAITLVLPFSGSISSVLVDLTTIIAAGQMEPAQSVFVQNFASAASISILVQGTGATIQCPAETQGWYLLAAPPQNQKFVFTSSVGSPITVTFVNYQVSPAVWSNGGSGTATVVTANQGAPGGASWPVLLTVNGQPITPANPFPTVDTNQDLTTYSVSNPPIQGVTTATESGLVGGVVYTGGTYSAGSQLPAQMNVNGQIIVNDPLGQAQAHTDSTTLATDINLVTTAVNAVATDIVASNPAIGGALGARQTLIGAEYLVTPPTRTTATVNPLLSDINGNLNVNIQNNGNAVDVINGLTPAAPSATGAINLGGTYIASPTEFATGQQGAVALNAYGAQKVDLAGSTPTYTVAGFPALFTTTANEPVVMIRGSATKIVKLRRIQFIVNGPTAGVVQLGLQRYTGATAWVGTGLTISNIEKFDVNDPTPTAVHYQNNNSQLSAGPTASAAHMRWTFAQILLIGGSVADTIWDFGLNGQELPTLRGTSDNFVIVIGNTGFPASSLLNFSFEWSEE